MSTEKITEVGPRDWARALSRLTAINDELALTLTTEPVYKHFFYLGRGLCPLPASHHLTARPITSTNPYYGTLIMGARSA